MIIFDTTKSTKFWKISPGYEGSMWDFFCESECIVLGSWFERTDRTIDEGDLRNYGSEDELREILMKQAKYLYEHGIRKEKRTTSTKYFWRFLTEVNIGDVVFAYSNKQLLGTAFITSDYDFRPDENRRYPHCRKVKWIIFKPPIRNEGDYRVTELERNLAFYPLKDVRTIKKIEQFIKASLDL